MKALKAIFVFSWMALLGSTGPSMGPASWFTMVGSNVLLILYFVVEEHDT